MGLFSRLFGRSAPAADRPAAERPAAGHPAAPDAGLVAVPIPPLVTLLVSLREQKGADLTETEVLDARDAAICMTMERSRAVALAERRGYRDLDPDNVWAEWQARLAGERDDGKRA